MTSKEILERYRDDSAFPELSTVVFMRKDCLEAMDEYAKQQAFAFGEYLGEYGWEILSEPHSEAGKWVSPTNLQYGFKTTEELYSLFTTNI